MYIYPHNPQWQEQYLKEVARIQWVFSVAAAYFHIGSTAVEGLYAKDCIDILGVTENIQLVRRYRSQLEAIGYVCKGAYGIEGREYFSKSLPKVHLHLFQNGDPNIEKHLQFVRIMANSAELREELNALKQSLHQQFPDNKQAYQAAKADFYTRILASPS